MRMKTAKKPNSTVKGDVHPKLVKRFFVELAKPATVIFNSITKNQIYPSQWKIEYGLPISKVPDAEMERHWIAFQKPLAKQGI